MSVPRLIAPSVIWPGVSSSEMVFGLLFFLVLLAVGKNDFGALPPPTGLELGGLTSPPFGVNLLHGDTDSVDTLKMVWCRNKSSS